MMPLPLDDGHNKTGRFRYGDLTVAVPANNPALLADREHLLALKKTLVGGIETGLNWSAASTTTTWEGVTVEGTPPRVTKLRLSDRGLAGELWGWIGELTELTELHLDDNALDGFLPSKLGRLTKLTSLRLGGNGFDDRQQGFRGCVPPSLYNIPENDAGTLTLSPCTAPANALPGYGYGIVGAGTYTTGGLIFDVQPGAWIEVVFLFPEDLFDFDMVTHIFDDFTLRGFIFAHVCSNLISDCSFQHWVVVTFSGIELERSSYRFGHRAIEYLIASIWKPTLLERETAYP